MVLIDVVSLVITEGGKRGLADGLHKCEACMEEASKQVSRYAGRLAGKQVSR